MSEKQITIRDVAHHSRLSVATVSRILNGLPGYTEETRKLVWNTANKLNYHPSQNARKMRLGEHSSVLGGTRLLMHIMHMSSTTVLKDFDTYMNCDNLQYIASAIDWEASRFNYFMVNYRYFHTEGFRSPLLLNGMIDGIVLGTPQIEVLDVLKGKLPLVLLDVSPSPVTRGIPLIGTDMSTGMVEALCGAREMGYRKCAVLTSPPTDPNLLIQPALHSELRILPQQCGLEIPDGMDMVDPISSATHKQVVMKIAQRLIEPIKSKKIDLILAEHNGYLETLLPVLAEHGIHVPDDVGMIGVSCFNSSRKKSNFACIATNWGKMVPLCLEILVSMIEKHKEFSDVNLVAPLIFLEGTVRRKQFEIEKFFTEKGRSCQ